MIGEFVIRERTPFWFMVYGVYLYLCSKSLRRASKALDPWVTRSHMTVEHGVEEPAAMNVPRGYLDGYGELRPGIHDDGGAYPSSF